ncbi:MAG: sugar MFS transporter [Bacteroidales bacterium]|jgi:glucose/galactose transporter|nr:sugar MFS transporter [Bacteroidales bacterium]
MQNTKNLTFSMFVIGSLFFVFGFVTWLNNILIPYMRTSCELTTQVQGYLVTFAFYIAYFVMSIPSSLVLKKTGYSNGMALGLVVMAIGCMMFIPGAQMRSYPMFLLGLFLQGSGLSLLQTASNPYVTVIGPIESAARRMSIMGICNKLAGMIGILVLYNALFSGKEHLFESIKEMAPGPEKEAMLQQLSNGVIIPYLIMTAVLIALVLFIKTAHLPDIVEEEKKIDGKKASIFSFPYLWLGILAIFFYVGAEVIAIDTLIPYGDYYGISTKVSHYFGVYALIALLVGYLCGILFVPKVVSQRKALIIQLFLSIALVVVALCTSGIFSIIAIICLSFAHAIMWPAIWPLAIHDLGDHTEFASALMVMAIVGGAVMPLIYGKIADAVNPHIAYALLFVCYAYILFFATVGCKIGDKS